MEMTPPSYSDEEPQIATTTGIKDSLSPECVELLKNLFPDAGPEQLIAAAKILQTVQEKVLATGEVDFEDIDHLHAPTDEEYRQYYERYHDDDSNPRPFVPRI